MAFTKKQRAAVKALVSCHETGKPVGNYSALVVLNDDAGITYGCHQATHKSGSLYKIVKMYCDISNSTISKALQVYLPSLKLASKRHILDKDNKIKSLLKAVGEEQKMRFAQDKVFEVNYFEPAVRAVEGSGWTSALALAVVYDSMIQGGWPTLRDRVVASNEKDWVKKYVAVRRKWLSSSKKQVVRNSVYRMTTFEKLIQSNNWSLIAPFQAHGTTINQSHLNVWMAADDPEKEANLIMQEPFIPATLEEQQMFLGNTEGIADEDGDGIPDAEDTDFIGDGESAESEETEAIPGSGITTDTTNPEAESDNHEAGDPPKAGEPVPDKAAEAGEAVVGGRPNDPPIIIAQSEPEKPSGWKTWTTTCTAVLSSLGVSVTAFGTWFWGAITDPTSAKFIFALMILGTVIAAGYGIYYLISRTIANARKEKFAHEIMMKELELRSMPARYNVKVDRRSVPRHEIEKKG